MRNKIFSVTIFVFFDVHSHILFISFSRYFFDNHLISTFNYFKGHEFISFTTVKCNPQ